MEHKPHPAGTTDIAVTVKAASLRSLLRLFPLESQLAEVELGDTWHPSAGFVEEGVLGPSPTVKTVLEDSYEFDIGLVHFHCTIDGLSVTYLDDKAVDELLPMRFSITGNSKSVNQFCARLARAQYDSDSLVMLD